MMCGDDEGALELARRRLRLIQARSEFAEARSERLLRACSDEASEVRLGGSDQGLLDRHAFRTRTMLDAERAVQAVRPDEVVIGDVFEAYATRAMVASDTIVYLQTAIGSVIVGGEMCQWMLAVAAELLHAVEAAADPNFGCRAHLAIDNVPDVGLVMRVTALGGVGRPVARCSGSAALERAGRVMRLMGSLTTAADGGDIVHTATFAGRFVDAGE